MICQDPVHTGREKSFHVVFVVYRPDMHARVHRSRSFEKLRRDHVDTSKPLGDLECQRGATIETQEVKASEIIIEETLTYGGARRCFRAG